MSSRYPTPLLVPRVSKSRYSSKAKSSSGTSRRPTTARSITRQSTARPRTSCPTLAGTESQEVICAMKELRNLTSVVGLAFVNLDTCEAVLCQVSDGQNYARTLQKLNLYTPCDILMESSSADANATLGLFAATERILEELEATVTLLESDFWSYTTGVQCLEQFALSDTALSYAELALGRTFAAHSLRIRIESSDGTMMIDVGTVRSLELLHNLEDANSRHCLFKVLNQTSTAMGARPLRKSILQPLTDTDTLNTRYDAVEELSSQEELFFAIKRALKNAINADRLLSSLVTVANEISLPTVEHAVNKAIMLRQFLMSISPLHDALATAQSKLLVEIRSKCALERYEAIMSRVETVLNNEIKYSTSPLDLRNNRTYAINAGVNGLLDAARQTYKSNTDSVYTYAASLAEEYQIAFEVKFDSIRHFYLRLKKTEVTDNGLPSTFINIVKKRNKIECSTLDMTKLNAKITACHNECLLLSDEAVQDLLNEAGLHVAALFEINENIAMLDVIFAFASNVTTRNYCRPTFDEVLGIKSARHPIKDQMNDYKFIPNDVFATTQKRFQVITGSNMSGKSTYIRSIALLVIMAQIGSFVPAEYASIAIRHQMFVRTAADDNTLADVSSFAAEMREMSFILNHIDERSIAIIDELGRGTSARDGLGIAIAVAEALVDSRAFVWFATHYAELATVLAQRSGVVNMHLTIDTRKENTLRMLYKVETGAASVEHYGIKVAKTMSLPPSLLKRAEFVAKDLERRRLQRQQTSHAAIVQQKRRLVLDLKEHLMQAYSGTLDGPELAQWLTELQREFVVRLGVLQEQETAARQHSLSSAASSVVASVTSGDSRAASNTRTAASSRMSSAGNFNGTSSEFTWTGAIE